MSAPNPADFLAGDCERPELVDLIDGVLAPPLLRSHLPLRARRAPRVLSGA